MISEKIEDLEKKLEALEKHQEFIGLYFILRDIKNMTPKNRAILTASIEKKAINMWGQYLEFAPVLKNLNCY